ncbi:MAG: hypothetical protein WC784_01985 [Candidatus Shapirobacteria bacterium]|jgi:hypothetical protein
MAVQTVTTSCNVDTLASFRSNDTLVINNGAVVTVNTNQTKFWSGVTINNGKLRIENTSTTEAIRFTTGRVSGATAQAITPASGLGEIEVVGNWIQIGTGTGTADKELTIPYTDYVPALWVETGVGTDTYEIWLNATGVYGPSLPKFIDGFDSIGTGDRGKFFIQKPNTTQDTILSLTNSTTTNTSRTITVSDTAGIFVGATITGTYIPANSVVETIEDETTITINYVCTGSASNTTVTIYNPFSQQLLPTVVFGDGTNGNILGNNIKVRIPNIMLTSDTSTKIQTLSATVGMNLNMANGGVISLDTCLLDEAYVIFTQAQTVTVIDVGFTVPPAITECYDLSMDGVGYGLPPVRRYYASGWFQRDIRDTQIPFNANYINDAILNNIVIACNQPTYTAGTAVAPIGIVTLGYSDNITATNFRLYQLQQYGAAHYGIACNAPVTNSTFTNIKVYGCSPIALYLSADNTFTNITFSISMFDAIMGWAANGRFGYNPETGANFVDNTPYYFKTRTFFTRDRSLYTESQEFSATPYLGDSTFPDYFTCYCSADKVVTMNWPERRPTYNAPSYEIYRDISSSVTIDSAHKVFSTNTSTVVAFANGGIKPTVTSATARTITFNAARTITASSGNFITDGFIAGDKLMITGGTSGTAGSKNNGMYTIASVDSATQMTVNEGLYTETAWGSGTGLTVTLTATHQTNKNTITASAGRTLTFNSAKTIIANSGSFIVDGYVIGDVIDISGTTGNDKTATISAITATQLTILETLLTESTYSADATITGRPVLNDTRYWYVLRKYNSVGVYHDSQPQEVWVHEPIVIYTNRLLQSEVLGTTWTTSNATVVSNQCNSPTSTPAATTANQLTADKITATATNGYITQTVSTISGQDYTFSAYVAIIALETITSVAGRIRLGTAETTFTATATWQRVSVTFTATSTSTTAQIQVDTNTEAIVVAGSIVNDGTTARPPYQLTTLTYPNLVDTRFPNLIRPWTTSGGGETANSGIEIGFGATPTAALFVECYCSTTRGFAPSLANRINQVAGGVLNIVSLSTNCLRNIINGVTQVGKAFESGAVCPLYIAAGSSDNKFLNFTLDIGFNMITNLIYPTTMANNNLCHNWSVSGYRNYTTTSSPIYSLNTASGLTLQNIRLDRSDIPINNAILDVIVKGMTGANARPAVTATTWALGGTSDGIAIAYVAVYDTIFNELYFTETTGALNILFNASSKTSKPYVLGNGAKFLNTGKLALQTAGDSITYTWPHKIKGVSGFANIEPKLNGLDLGTTTTLLEGLKVEYSINGGGYTLATAANLSAENVDEVAGFDFSVKLTAMLGMKYSTQTSQFVVGETIEGETSGVTAHVDADFNLGTTGTLWLSAVSGTFTGAEYVKLQGGARRARNVVTNTSFALFPSFTSYIDGLQIYTLVDQSVLYPATVVTITLENIIPDSVYYIYNSATNALVATGTAQGTPDPNESTIDYELSVVFESQFDINVNVRKSTDPVRYLPYETGSTVTAAGASVFIAQIVDTVISGSYGAIASDWMVYESYKIIKHTGGTTVYSVNALYSYLLDYFDNAGFLDDEVPIVAATPTEYKLSNGWYLDDTSTQFLSGGSITTDGWDDLMYVLTMSGTPTNPVGDIGKTVQNTLATHTGMLVDYTTSAPYKWYVRKILGTFTAESVDIVSGTGEGTVGTVVTGETIWSNVFTLGSLVAETVLDVYQNDTKITSWWSTSGNVHIDILVKVKEADVEIDSGNLTILARKYGTLYDHFVIDASSGRNPVPLAAFTDGNNPAANEATVADIFDFIPDSNFDFGYASKDMGVGAKSYDVVINCGSRTILQVYEYLKYITRTGSTTPLNGVVGEYYTGVGDVQFAFDGESGTFIEGQLITGSAGVYGYLTSIKVNPSGYMTLRNVHGTFTNNMSLTQTPSGATALVNGTVTSLTPQKQAPFGSYAGGTFFGARGVWLENVAPADANNYQLIDAFGDNQTPPTSVSITISGVEEDDVVAVFKTTGNNKIIDKSYLHSHATANASGSTSWEVDANTPIPSDTPATGIIRLVKTTTNLEERIEYTSWVGTVFTLDTAHSGGYGVDDTAYVPFIDAVVSTGESSLSVSFNYASSCYLYTIVRHKGIIPFDVKGQITSTGYSLSAIRTIDSIVS